MKPTVFAPRFGAALSIALAACVPQRVHQEPVVQADSHVASPDGSIARARAENDAAAARDAGARDSITAVALSSCRPAVCAALARGEVAVGMSEAQLFAATHTTGAAWSSRQSGDAAILVAASDELPRDAAGRVAMVQLRGGAVTAVSYRDPQGIRTVMGAEDATTESRAAATAEALLREGDALVASGDLQLALDRYDRASVLKRDPMIDYRIATVLDKQLRPLEALVRYQKFLNQLEIDRINARGEANAKLGAAMIAARERIVVLETRAR
jgi:tetratricopeptide (TPR) repeat protein